MHFHRLVDSAGAALHHPSVIHTGVSVDNEMVHFCSVVLRPGKEKDTKQPRNTARPFVKILNNRLQGFVWPEVRSYGKMALSCHIAYKDTLKHCRQHNAGLFQTTKMYCFPVHFKTLDNYDKLEP